MVFLLCDTSGGPERHHKKAADGRMPFPACGTPVSFFYLNNTFFLHSRVFCHAPSQ